MLYARLVFKAGNPRPALASPTRPHAIGGGRLGINMFAALSHPKPHRSVERGFSMHAGNLVTASIVFDEMRIKTGSIGSTIAK